MSSQWQGTTTNTGGKILGKGKMYKGLKKGPRGPAVTLVKGATGPDGTEMPGQEVRKSF